LGGEAVARWGYEASGGVIHIIDDDWLEQLAIPVATVLCVDGTTDHRWHIRGGVVRCSACNTLITQLD
jgi:hypothetical protein